MLFSKDDALEVLHPVSLSRSSSFCFGSSLFCSVLLFCFLFIYFSILSFSVFIFLLGLLLLQF